ncbi:DUF456 domain-containing protein [Faecalibacter rhinopitheci]|uniref:DUF456 domain-containing protein n=1 Tax=Faecalibacter rhinopitheci TaxID=2779678 RepID=A0A8J7KA45_9FLAO|nr:DUF456 domain-containing protein [Faecalibacter rhinopitheci]MBF0597055.1 DUF456 domain-containing protein [Faecalibacter rhinopitheci]MBQ0147682.1 DUF456 domain-containing protein [Candidatus Onthonaster equi]
MEDFIINIIAAILIFVGIIGTVLPAIPGAPLALAGLLVFKLFSGDAGFGWEVIIIGGIFVIIGSILDYLLPVALTKKFGGSKYGIWGSIVGLIIGLFIPPFGFIIGPFIGAFLAELIFASKDVKSAIKSAFGSFVGFLLTTGYDFILCLIFAGILIYDVFIS